MKKLLLLLVPAMTLILPSCTPMSGVSGPTSLADSNSIAARKAQIANEPRGNFFYGRRYVVKKTRFWGYLRKPGQPATSAKLVIFNETRKHNPDRLPEVGPGKNYGFDNNYEYKIYGRYTGRKLYEPNSNQFLPEFLLTNYELLDTNPGWLFRPNEKYSPSRITLLP